MGAKDGWDVARWTSAGIGLAGFFISYAADDDNHKALGTGAAAVSVGVRLALEVTTPPRCQVCGGRTVQASGQFACPQGHGVASWKP